MADSKALQELTPGFLMLSNVAEAATDLDPVVMLIVSLLAAVSATNDRIAFTHGALPPHDVGTDCSPIRSGLVRPGRKWDKENRSSSGLCSGVDLPRSEPGAEPLFLKRKSQREENITFQATTLKA